jgi:hypothetical protein
VPSAAVERAAETGHPEKVVNTLGGGSVVTRTIIYLADQVALLIFTVTYFQRKTKLPFWVRGLEVSDESKEVKDSCLRGPAFA